MKYSIGIDWSDKSHTICIRELESRRIMIEFEIEHSVEGIEQLASTLQTLEARPEKCRAAIETNQGALVNYLLAAGYHIHPIPPAAVKDYRGRRRRSGAKSDRDDARLLADILCVDLHLYPQLASDSPLVREIQATCRAREQLVKQRTQALNQLRQNLKLYFPVAVDLFSRLDAPILNAFLSAFPTQRNVQQAGGDALRTFFNEQSYKRPDCVQNILDRLLAPAIPVPAWQAEAGQRLTAALLEQLAVLNQHIKQLQNRLAELLDQHPDASLFLSLPRVGVVLAAGLLGEIGDCRDKFASAAELQALAGTCPVTIQSGGSRQVLFRFACNKPLRMYFQQLARQTARSDGSAWARGYFVNQMERGHTASRAYRALANRWARIIFRMWKEHTLYDENYHLSNIVQRGAKAPLLVIVQAA